jgi:AraC family transcriptional regulator of adaptative response/methylated-DNA-[protein]-cysteine methyltransferase
MKKNGRDATIHFAIGASPLGRMLVAYTDRGLCSVAFAGTDAELRQELRARFREATLVEDPDSPALFTQVLRFFDEPGSPLPPLDLAGTPFQQRVWDAMARIPRGTTVEYGQFAAELGLRKAARAVGAAIGQNPIALLYPCHRLVAKGGELHRYRWGVDRKQWLLRHEGAPLQADGQRELPLHS